MSDETVKILKVLEAEYSQFDWTIEEDSPDYICGENKHNVSVDLYPHKGTFRAFVTVDAMKAIKGQEDIKNTGLVPILSIYREADKPLDALKEAIGSVNQGVEAMARQFYATFPKLVPTKK